MRIPLRAEILDLQSAFRDVWAELDKIVPPGRAEQSKLSGLGRRTKPSRRVSGIAAGALTGNQVQAALDELETALRKDLS